MFKIKLILLFVGFFFGFNAQENNLVETSLLWEIKGKKVKKTSYLFGTMHLMPKNDFYFPDHLVEKLNSTDLLIMEIGGLQEQMKAAKLLMLDSGQVWDYFTPNQLDTLFTFFNDKLGMDSITLVNRFSKFKPLVLTQTLTSTIFGEQPKSYELELELKARQAKMSIIGLETIEEQISILVNMEKEDQVEMIMQGIRDFETQNELTELINIYKEQDLEKLYTYFKENGGSIMNYEAELLTNRNRKWIPELKKHIKKQQTFIAVGAGHLGGEFGLINLLKKEGYTISPVKF